MEKDVKFDLNSIEKTFVNYNVKQIIKGSVVALKDYGAIFNIGGKKDAFIPREEYSNFENAQIGDEFEVLITGQTNEEGYVLASKNNAEGIVKGNKDAERIKLGSHFTFIVSKIKNDNLVGYLGEFEVVIPNGEISLNPIKFLGRFLKKQVEAVATSINGKLMSASIKLLEKQKQEIIENNFWPSLFINKKVKGRVEKIMPYGAFVDVDGVDCFVHISNLSYDRVTTPDEVISEGEIYDFRVVKFDKETKKIELGLKQNFEDPRKTLLKSLEIGQVFKGKVAKLLPFGAIIRLENGVDGLLHVSDITNITGKRIYEIVKLEQEVEVMIKDVDIERKRVSFIYTLKQQD